MTTAIGVPVGIIVSRGIARAWISARPDNPPRRPTDPNVNWVDAASWAALSAVGVAAGQLATTKGAATIWRGLTGTEPPPAQERLMASAHRQARANKRARRRAGKAMQKQS